MSKYTIPRYCKLQGCNELIPEDRHGNSGYCSDLQTIMGNSVYNATYYKRRVKYTKALATNEFALKRLGEIFGYEVLFESKMATPLLFDWNIVTRRIRRNDELINVVGNYGYIIYKNELMKVYKI